MVMKYTYIMPDEYSKRRLKRQEQITFLIPDHKSIDANDTKNEIRSKCSTLEQIRSVTVSVTKLRVIK